MFGLLNLNKPKGDTSRDAVNRVLWLARRVTGEKKIKVGHAGTLDPIATGVLVVCVGPATRLIEHVQRMPKQYRGTFLFGRRSPSDDVELEPELIPGSRVPTEAEIVAELPALVGSVQQVPPAYSAIKVDGQKSYKRARQGEEFELPSRPVSIYSIDLVRYDYPELVLDIRCGSGTYIRSIGRDLAEALGTGAVMCELERTAIGDFRSGEGLDPGSLDESTLTSGLLPPERALGDTPRVELTLEEAEELRHGRPIERGVDLPQEEQALIAPGGSLLGLGKIGRGGKLWPVRVFGGFAGR